MVTRLNFKINGIFYNEGKPSTAASAEILNLVWPSCRDEIIPYPSQAKRGGKLVIWCDIPCPPFRLSPPPPTPLKLGD